MVELHEPKEEISVREFYANLSDSDLRKSYSAYKDRRYWEISIPEGETSFDVGNALASEVINRAGSIENLENWVENFSEIFNGGLNSGNSSKIFFYKGKTINERFESLLLSLYSSGLVPFKDKSKLVKFISNSLNDSGYNFLSGEFRLHSLDAFNSERIYFFKKPINQILYKEVVERGEGDLEIMGDNLKSWFKNFNVELKPNNNFIISKKDYS